MKPCSLDVVVPLFNELECVGELHRRMSAVRTELGPEGVEVRLILVDDGSTDETVQAIQTDCADEEWIALIELARNFGHQAAVTAGVDASTADYTCVLDADLQDPPELVGLMLEKLHNENLDVVYGVRVSRDGDSRFKRATAMLFYRFIRRSSGLDIPIDTGDFRVMDSRIAGGLRQLPEHNRFVRALIPWMGCRAEPFPYERDERFAGSTKYPFSKMFTLAMHALFSLSMFPIRLVQGMGVFFLAVAGLAIPVVGGLWLAGVVQPGAPLMIAVALTLQTGIIVLAVGIVGAFVHRIQDEVKGRPLYVRRDGVVGDRHIPAHLPHRRDAPPIDVADGVVRDEPVRR